MRKGFLARLAHVEASVFYHRQQLTVKSLNELKRVIQRQPTAEVAMVLVARPAWSSPIRNLGTAYLRRTWCNHLFLEFFATHPQVIMRRHEKIGGVGDAMIYQIVGLAEELGVPCIWGEATEQSHTWYEEHLGIDRVLDHFFIEDNVMLRCLNEMRKAKEDMLAHRSKT